MNTTPHQANTRPVSNLDCSFAVELSRIWKQLDHITRFIDPGTSERACLVKDQLPGDFFDDHDPLAGFPIMIIKNQPFLTLLSLDRSLPIELEQMERSRRLFSPRPSSVPAVMIDLTQALE